MQPTDDFSIFPITTGVNAAGRLSIAGHDLRTLAETYGTPLYVYDGATIRHQAERLQSLFRQYYPGEAAVAYAVKAYFSHALAVKMAEMGLGADVVSYGEIRIAQQAGFPAEGIHLHGNNKSQPELEAALAWGVQAIVVDSLDEMVYLEELARKHQRRARIWLRITPDLRVNTHPHIETSHADSKFGLHIQNGEAAEAIRFCKNSPHFHLAGLHTHLGSQIFQAEPYRMAIEMLYEVADAEGFVPEEISPGGGWGVRYTEADGPDNAEPWVRTVCEAVAAANHKRGWKLPKVILEPGRWMVARAGVALYRVGSQKVTPSGTHIVAIDGGLADNPRVALYGAQYTARVVERPSDPPTEAMRVVGKFCESGDVLIPHILLPPVQRGELLATPAAGAYQLSMSSNYNFAARPVVLWLEEGGAEVMQCCEHPEQPGWWVYTP